MSYIIIYTRGHSLPREGDFSRQNKFAEFLTVKDAGLHRQVSGDLVVDSKTLLIDQSDAWLFEWEKADPTSYARQMQTADRRAK